MNNADPNKRHHGQKQLWNLTTNPLKLQGQYYVHIQYKLSKIKMRFIFITFNNCTSSRSNSVSFVSCTGTQNYSGLSVFSVVPVGGSIAPGQSQDITVTFQPDHPSVNYSDRLTIELMNKVNRTPHTQRPWP